MKALREALLHSLRHWRWAVFIGAANLFSNGIPFMNSGLEVNTLSALAYNVLEFGFPLLLALHLADRAVDQGRVGVLPAYGLAVLTTTVCGVWVIGPLLAPLLGKVDWWNWMADIGLAGTSSVWLGLGVAVYAQQRLQRRARVRLREAQSTHAQAQRELAAARLLALQARVDPALLFERLQTVDVELEQVPMRARARLDALIDWLRALQPHADARVSTLGRECQAVAAYARMTSADARHTERLHLQIDGRLAEHPLAPQLLLPLARGLLNEAGTLWSLRADGLPDQGLQLRIEALGPDLERAARAVAALDLDGLRRDLQAVHGRAARLTIDSEPLPRLTLTLPPWPAS